MSKSHKVHKNEKTIPGEYNTLETPPKEKIEQLSYEHGGMSFEEEDLHLNRLPKLQQKLKEFIVKYERCVILGCWTLAVIVSGLFWKHSLVGCNGGLIECLVAMLKKVKRIFIFVLMFCIIHFTIFLMGIHSKDKVLKAIGILEPICAYIYLQQTSSGFTWSDHSQGNFMVCQVLWATMGALYIITLLHTWLYRFSRKLFYFWLFILAVLTGIFIWKRIVHSCDTFSDGLVEGDHYSTEGGECQWIRSKVCWHYTVLGLMRPIYWFRDDCAREITPLTFYNQKATETGIIGFPNPNNFDVKVNTFFSLMQNKTLNDAKEVNESDITSTSNDMEVFLDKRKKNQEKLIINLKDYRLTHPGTKFLPHDKDHLNILQIFVDTVSRNRFHRRFTQVKRFLENYHYSKGKGKRVYEFFRFHSVRGWTNPNLIAQTYGFYNDSKYEREEKRIDSYAREKGYVTGITNDLCNAIEDEILSKTGG